MVKAMTCVYWRSAHHGDRGGNGAVIENGNEPRHGGDESGLRAKSEKEALNLLVRVRPPMKSLQAVERLVREVGMNNLQRVGKHGPERAEQNRPKAHRRGEEKKGRDEAKQAIAADCQQIQQERAVEHERRADLGIYRARPDAVIGMRDRVQCKMTGEPDRECGRRMGRHQARKSGADDGV